MSQHRPLLFTFRDTIYGVDFAAQVVTHGRVVMTNEGDTYWMYGVLPGGLAAEGPTPDDAYAEFRRTFLGVLFDIAESARGFDDFEAQAREFFQAETAETARQWAEGVEKVRAGQITAKGIPKHPAEAERGIDIKLIEQFASSQKFALAGAVA